MNRLEYTQADVTALHDIAAPWSVQAKLDSKGISRFAGVLPPGTSISLSGFIQAFMVGGENDPRVPVLREVWREVEQNNYYRALMTIKPYRDAQAGFEKQLKRMVRGKGPYDELDKRLTYTYVTGDLIR